MSITGARPALRLRLIYGWTGRKAGPLSWITSEDYTLEQGRRNNRLLIGQLLLVKRTWARVHSPDAYLINYLDPEIIVHPNLA